MKAILIRQGRPVLVDRAEPATVPGEARIGVSIAGVCGTDLELARGYMQFDGVPGHEFVGRVEEASDPEWVGRRVVGEINVGCGACGACARGLGGHCPERTVLGIHGRDGAFAERIALPVRNLHQVPARMPDEVAVFTEPLAAAFEILEQVDLLPGTRALVLGDGRLGQLCAAVLAGAGCEPMVCGRHPEKLRRLERFGLDTVSSPERLTREFDLVVDATGTAAGLRSALSLVRPRGTIVLKSTYHGPAEMPLAGLVIDEIRLVGSRCGPFRRALDHLAKQPSTVEGLVSAIYPLHEAARAFEHSERGDALKILLTV